jgi:Ca2+-binding RTX toxin-like protein
VVSSYTGSVQIDGATTVEFDNTYTGAAVFGGAITGSGGTLKFDHASTGPITVVNSNDKVIAQHGSDNWINAIVSYALPANIDALFLYGGTQGTGNSDAAGDALYALDAGITQTLVGNSLNDTFVVYNSTDVVVPKTGSRDVVYTAVDYTLPTGVDTLILEGSATQGIGNSDAAGDALYAANPNQVATLTGNSATDTFVIYNSSDVVVPKAGSHDLVYSAVNYTLPTGIDRLILEGTATQGTGNSDAAGDALYAANPSQAATLTGHSHNDTFVVYNSADTVIGQANSTDTVYAAANFILPTNVDTLVLEGAASQGTGNGDAANVLYGNAGVASTLVAGSGNDILAVIGTAGTLLTGGAGHDTFALPNAMGHDEVTNFNTAKDMLQFNTTLFANFTAAMAHASQIGANTVFTIDANDTVKLDNVAKSSLAASNFHFN